MNGRGFWIGLVMGAIAMGLLGQWEARRAQQEPIHPPAYQPGQ